MSTATDATPADSSSAPVAPAPVPLESLTSAERAKWRVTGERPSVTPDATAASSSAPAGDQPVSTETSTPAASEPAKGKGVKARSVELETEIADLREKLKLRAALRDELDRLGKPAPDATPAASSPAPVPSVEALQPDLRQPMLTEDQFFERYPGTAYGQYSVYAAKYVLADDRATATQQAQTQQLQRTWGTAVDAVKADHPDYDLQIQALQALPETPTNQVIADALVAQGNARLYYHLATHLEDAKRLVTLPPAAALVELGKLDAQISPATHPAPKTITTAPPPPPSIGSRPAVPADEIDAALAARDFRRYKALANARDVAAAGR